VGVWGRGREGKGSTATEQMGVSTQPAGDDATCLPKYASPDHILAGAWVGSNMVAGEGDRGMAREEVGWRAVHVLDWLDRRRLGFGVQVDFATTA
jgi:hypothetical protein